MNARIAFALAASIGLAACQGDGPIPTETSSPMSAAATQEDLFTHVPNPALNASQRSLLATIRGRESTGEVSVFRLAGTPARLLQQGRAIRFSVAPGRNVVAVGAQAVQRGASDVSWGGPTQGENGSVQLVLTGTGVTATIRTGDALYRVEPLGGGLHAISRIDMASLPPEHTADNPSGVLFPTEESAFDVASGLAASLTAASTQNVLVVYTASAASATADIAGLIQLAVDETNQGYANSAVGITQVKAHVAAVSYNEAGRSFSQHVSALQGTSDGMMDEVHTLRNTYAADVVVLVVNDAEACGMAAAIKATASNAFAAAHYTCITGYYSFAHEVGHLQGARHDRRVDRSTSPYPYGHGYVDPNRNWRTIMAYGNACNNCQRINWWSNPLVTYPATGQVMGTAAYEDNARVLNTTAATVAAFR